MTVTPTVPVPAGAKAVIWVSLLTVTPVAAADPKSTVDTPVNPDPLIVTRVPPASGPAVGVIELTEGAFAYRKVPLSEPPAVVTRTTALPAEPGGVTAVMVASSFTLNAAAAPAMVTLDAPVRPAPQIVTVVPPPTGPAGGETVLTVGAFV